MVGPTKTVRGMNCKFKYPINLSQSRSLSVLCWKPIRMKGIKVILVPTLLIVLCNSKPGKMRVLPEPVVPSQFQRSKFLYDSKNEKTDNGDGKKVDEQSTCKKESEALGFPERTVIGVAGREPEEIFINFKFKTPLSLAAIIIGCWLSQGGLYLYDELQQM